MSTWKTWLRAAAIRALKTCCETAVAVIGTSYILSDVNWWVVLSASVLAGIVSLLVSIAGIPEVDDGDSLPDIIEDGNDDGAIDTDAEVCDEDDQEVAANDDDGGDDSDDGDGDE